MRIFLVSVMALAACTGKATVDDDFASFAGLDEKADAFSYRMQIAGSLAYGEEQPVAYTHTPRYRAVKFAGSVGDQVDVWVRSPDGDAVAWLLDNSFHVLASNDDADDTTLDSHLVATLPASASATHYIVLRDYALADSTYTVALAGTPVGACQVDADCSATPVGADAVAECNGATHACESVAIPDIRCGGFIAQPHLCPAGYSCHIGPPNPDAPGHCLAN